MRWERGKRGHTGINRESCGKGDIENGEIEEMVGNARGIHYRL